MTARLLLVDADRDLADTLADVLRREGHRVWLARDGKEGRARIEETLPEVIVCDVEMPHLTGPDMAYRMFLRDAGCFRARGPGTGRRGLASTPVPP